MTEAFTLRNLCFMSPFVQGKELEKVWKELSGMMKRRFPGGKFRATPFGAHSSTPRKGSDDPTLKISVYSEGGNEDFAQAVYQARVVDTWEADATVRAGLTPAISTA